MLKAVSKTESYDKHDLIKIWLIACLVKTLKEQTDLKEPIVIFAS